jgi:hypothetical protein
MHRSLWRVAVVARRHSSPPQRSPCRVRPRQTTRSRWYSAAPVSGRLAHSASGFGAKQTRITRTPANATAQCTSTRSGSRSTWMGRAASRRSTTTSWTSPRVTARLRARSRTACRSATVRTTRSPCRVRHLPASPERRRTPSSTSPGRSCRHREVRRRRLPYWEPPPLTLAGRPGAPPPCSRPTGASTQQWELRRSHRCAVGSTDAQRIGRSRATASKSCASITKSPSARGVARCSAGEPTSCTPPTDGARLSAAMAR